VAMESRSDLNQGDVENRPLCAVLLASKLTASKAVIAKICRFICFIRSLKINECLIAQA